MNVYLLLFILLKHFTSNHQAYVSPLLKNLDNAINKVSVQKHFEQYSFQQGFTV